MKKYQWEPTRSNPGRWSWLLSDIAELEGVQTTKTIYFTNIDKARNAKIKFHEMIFTIDGNQIKCIKCEMIAQVKSLIFEHFTIPVSEYTAGISVVVNKTLADYKTKPKRIGDYKCCEGGGWYSMANLYELNGVFYTDAY